ncbi:MAG: putative toxin-antitoxin system toxin component, PIN family [Candidatus Dormibacteraeota bacterium]|nr:putative toxin-antitoxin system toxin component, PIN family [Candidatus Dormibacteraeota bacterium]MBV9526430.1 putative toxin-antitoxin system toxin component, PIN family [Candidatus Dormibacteraeota bacterium]
MRAVLDVNVLISALLAPAGSSAAILLHWLRGAFDLVVNADLLAELTAALRYPKLLARIAPGDGAAFVDLLKREALVAESTALPPPARSRDPRDDYLLALAAAANAVLVSWDRDLLDLPGVPVQSPPQFLESMGTGE